MKTHLLNCPAPAKLNLFLHIVGRREDGYHLLQSVFQLIDRCDYLDFSITKNGQISRSNAVIGIAEQEDLVIRAATLLQKHCQVSLGAEITLHKHLPMGAGLGGGSSDAATTLLALNQLWQCHLSRQELMYLGLQLGADVPFFIFGQNAFVEGIGEELQTIETPEQWFVVIEPGVHVPTPAIFSSKELTRNTKRVRITDFSSTDLTKSVWKNDLQAVACALYPQIQTAIDWLAAFGDTKMTGSGACVFCACSDEASADNIIKQAPQNWGIWKTKALQQHPMYSWLQA
ncbi:MAG: 4-(cytidine 5'-diphospho)-2-C-methyl-D-erythritol kinase [Undibacterium sp.]|nr:4-(cytidine 5'-diphospho)-2-C-methyl-D-erythritol kinase [Undibacterium sp.]